MDETEVEKFKSLADIWWNPQSCARYLHSMNKLRIPFMLDSLKSTGILKQENSEKPLKDVAVLDVGCGGGIMSEEISRLGAKVTGVDGVKELIDLAVEHASQDKSLKDLEYVTDSIQSFGEKNAEKYDVVIASEVLEHTTDKAGVIASSVKCLKPGGSIIITTESKSFLSKIVTIYWMEYITRIIPKGAHEIHMYITPEDTQKLLEENNCTVKSIRGTYYNVFNNKWYFSPFITWYIMHAVKNKPKE